jgi:hypothetical protein
MVWVAQANYPAPPTDQALPNRQPNPQPDSPTSMGYAMARPAGAHGETFNVAFCGGEVKEINQAIDYRVYQQLMTPNGAKCVYKLAPSAILPGAYYNADPTAQLKDGDY